MLAQLARYSAFIGAVAILFAAGVYQSRGGNGHAVVPGRQAGDAQHEIHALVDQYTRALLNRDATALARIWADDLTFINLHGALLNKQNRMDNIRTRATAFESIRLAEEQIRAYGDAAVATFRVALEARYSGQEGSGDYRVTTVWARPKGMWQMVAVQMTRIAP